jgi:hypothetical protein
VVDLVSIKVEIDIVVFIQRNQDYKNDAPMQEESEM